MVRRALAADPAERFSSAAELYVAARGAMAAARIEPGGVGRERPGTDPDAEPRPAATGLAGGIASDRVDPTRGIPLERDDLGAAVWVSMLATAIVDRKTPMPLSIGIFGEWGSGKSYFMGLLRSEVERLARSGRDPYLTDVVQIGFNAWHYADTNLWASLGDEIFRQLAGPSDDPDRRRQRLRAELAKGSAERRELEARTAQARDETVRLKAQLAAAAAERRRSATDLLHAITGSRELATRLGRVWRRLGIRGEAEQAQVLADQLRGAAAESVTLRGLLRQPRAWALAGVAVLALVAVAASSWLPAVVGKLVGGGIGAAGLLATLAVAVSWTSRARQALADLRAVVSELTERAAAASRERTAGQVTGLVDRLRRAEADEDVARSQLDEVVAQVGELARQLSDLMPGSPPVHVHRGARRR